MLRGEWASLGLLVCLGAGCVDYGLVGYGPEQGAYEIGIEGCVECFPGEGEHPTRVLVAIDGSQSMLVADPDAERAAAARRLVERQLAHAQTEFCLIRFASGAEALSDFTADAARLEEALAVLGEAGGSTNFPSALALAGSLLESEMRSQTEQDRGRSSYHAVFLCGGVFPASGPEDIRQSVRQIAELGERYGAAGLRLHFAYLAAGEPEPVRAETAVLLSGLASIGSGAYLEFGSAAEIDFGAIPVLSALPPSPSTPVWAVNTNALPGPDGWLPDSDADGLDDGREIGLGLDPLRADSDGDGYGDLVELLLGLDPGRPDPCADGRDGDGDGLRDCEEAALSTDPASPDSDADGLPDLVELRCGSSPLLPGPLTSPWDTARYRYSLQPDELDFRIEHIPLVPGLGAGNTILVQVDVFPASPYMHPGRFRTARLHMAEPFGQSPGRIWLEDSDFE
ncbi:MAG: VWA domain-containing protein [Deltaproteobacteria bacterium]|nr:VWA domain-containing protein [Deltaproteobacteria bacterium]